MEVICAGQALGLSTLLARLSRLISVRTITPCQLLSIDAAGLLKLVAEEASLVTALLRAEANEFRALVRLVCDLKLRTTTQRLGCYLLALSTEKHANVTALRLPFDKRLLAARLGCRQENLSRAFAALRGLRLETHGARSFCTISPASASMPCRKNRSKRRSLEPRRPPAGNRRTVHALDECQRPEGLICMRAELVWRLRETEKTPDPRGIRRR